MGIFELFGKKQAPVTSAPYSLEVTVHPLRIPAHKQDYVEMQLNVKNTSHEEQLTAVVITVPKGLGFEQSTLSNQRELRLGHLQPGESKHHVLNIYSSQRTAPGNYHVRVFAISHYRNYGYVLNEVKHEFVLRAV